MALRCSIRVLYVVVRRQSPSYGLTTPADRKLRRHALTLIVSFLARWTLAIARVAGSRGRMTGCVCLHALSSFQRTDNRSALDAPLFPTFPSGNLAGSPCRGTRRNRPSRPSLGEPSEVTSTTRRCQHFFDVNTFLTFFSRSPTCHSDR